MEIWSKCIEYKSYNITLTVILKTKVTNGDIFHTIIVNCLDIGDYYKKDEIKNSLLQQRIEFWERGVKKDIDLRLGKSNNNDETLLIRLGFQKQ